jgi:hypothetical protein
MSKGKLFASALMALVFDPRIKNEKTITTATGTRAAMFKPVKSDKATIEPATAPPVAPARF